MNPDPAVRELSDAQRWTRSFLEARGVRFPVPSPLEHHRLNEAVSTAKSPLAYWIR